MSTSTEAAAGGTADAGSGGGLYRLLAWLSPAFPTGGFSYSHGLEAAAEAGCVHDRASLETWVAAIVADGSGRIDADLLRDAYRAAAAGDADALAAVNRRGLAYRSSAELALEAAQQGAAFLQTCRAAWRENPSPPSRGEREGPGAQRWEGEVGIDSKTGDRSGIPHLTPPLSAPRGGEREDNGVCHSVAFGEMAAEAGIALADALLGYLQAFAANLVSAGLRLGIVGQTDGQRILAALEPAVAAAAAAAVHRNPENFGSATFAADLFSVTHETQYSRLFRS